MAGSSYHYDENTYELSATRDSAYKSYLGGVGIYYYNRLKQLSTKDLIDSIAQTDAASGKCQTFQQLLESSTKLCQYMRSLNIQPGNNISMCSYNHINSAVVIIATQFVGAVLSSTDPNLSIDDTKYLLNLIKPKMVFITDGSEELIAIALDAIQLQSKIISISTKCSMTVETIDDIILGTNVNTDFIPYYVTDLSTICSILFSSGTTGLPKAICLSHNYFLNPLTCFPTISLKWVFLNYASFYWISTVFMLLMSVHMGSSRLICKSFQKETHWDLIIKQKVSYLIISNTFFMEASKYLTADYKTLSTLKSIIIGGGLVPKQMIIDCINKLPHTPVGYAYALTEGGLIAQFKHGDKIGSNGKPEAINQTIKIVDPHTEKNLPLNQIGEIRVKQQCQMVGYYGMDSTDAWDAQGFLKTGDLGYMDNDFNLFVVERLKEMFKYRGWHIVPAKIENVLGVHPDVLHAIVIGKPTGDEDENHAMAVVCLHEDAHVTGAELEVFVNEQMDEINQIRAGIQIIAKSEFEFTVTGKINRRQLKNKILK